MAQDPSAPVTRMRLRAATMSLRPDGILQVDVDPGAAYVVEDAEEHLVAETILARGEFRPLLVKLGPISSITREARKLFGDPGERNIISACALIVDSPVARMIGNFLLEFNKPPYPAKLFTSEEDANAWLREHLQKLDKIS